MSKILDSTKKIGTTVNKELGYEVKAPSWYDTVFGAWRVRQEKSRKFRRLDGIDFYTPPVTLYLINPNDVLYSFNKSKAIKAMEDYMKKNGKAVKIKGEMKSDSPKTAYKIGPYYYIQSGSKTTYNVYGTGKMKGLMSLVKEGFDTSDSDFFICFLGCKKFKNVSNILEGFFLWFSSCRP